MPHKNPPRIFPVDTRGLIPGAQTWAWVDDEHGGYRPIDPALRGDIDLACPSGGHLLVRDGTRELLDRSIFKCPRCKKVFGGENFAPKDR